MSRVPASATDMRHRIAGWRAAAQRERELWRNGPVLDPDQSLTLALELCALDAGEPGLVDPLREREILSARATWTKLRKHYGCPLRSVTTRQ
jgi:hypothetical protein